MQTIAFTARALFACIVLTLALFSAAMGIDALINPINAYHAALVFICPIPAIFFSGLFLEIVF